MIFIVSFSFRGHFGNVLPSLKVFYRVIVPELGRYSRRVVYRTRHVQTRREPITDAHIRVHTYVSRKIIYVNLVVRKLIRTIYYTDRVSPMKRHNVP